LLIVWTIVEVEVLGDLWLHSPEYVVVYFLGPVSNNVNSLVVLRPPLVDAGSRKEWALAAAEREAGFVW
jgi:hypothetical protein